MFLTNTLMVKTSLRNVDYHTCYYCVCPIPVAFVLCDSTCECVWLFFTGALMVIIVKPLLKNVDRCYMYYVRPISVAFVLHVWFCGCVWLFLTGAHIAGMTVIRYTIHAPPLSSLSLFLPPPTCPTQRVVSPRYSYPEKNASDWACAQLTRSENG